MLEEAGREEGGPGWSSGGAWPALGGQIKRAFVPAGPSRLSPGQTW